MSFKSLGPLSEELTFGNLQCCSGSLSLAASHAEAWADSVEQAGSHA